MFIIKFNYETSWVPSKQQPRRGSTNCAAPWEYLSGREVFYDRIVRDDHELERIQEYIRSNPLKWAEDRDNLMGLKIQPQAKSIDDYWCEIFDLN